jgi:F0F1-type ATP synthase assembly protein I
VGKIKEIAFQIAIRLSMIICIAILWMHESGNLSKVIGNAAVIIILCMFDMFFSFRKEKNRQSRTIFRE